MRIMPRTLTVDANSPAAEVIAEAASVLRAGGLVALPTETVYGLAARLFDASALARVFVAKGRPTSHPLIAHVANIDLARVLTTEWSKSAELLARQWWPGPLTLIAPRAATVPDLVSGGGPTVAMRNPAHPVMRAVIDALGDPIAAPSANKYQRISPTRAEHVIASLGESVDLVIDAGPCQHGIESTVVDLSCMPPRLLRSGPILAVDLRSILPDLVVDTKPMPDGAAPRTSPGLDAKHYSPRAAVEIVSREQLRCRLQASGAEVIAVLTWSAQHLLPDARAGLLHFLPDDARGYARGLYEALYALDRPEVHVILVEAPPEEEAWAPVWDRLTRASA